MNGHYVDSGDECNEMSSDQLRARDTTVNEEKEMSETTWIISTSVIRRTGFDTCLHPFQHKRVPE